MINITGAPSYFWPDCVSWLVDCHNFSAHQALGYRTPYEKRHGSTPDILAYVLFRFWETILQITPFLSLRNHLDTFLVLPIMSVMLLFFFILSQDGSPLHRSVACSALGKPLSGFPHAQLQHVSYPVGSVPALPPSVSNQDDGGFLFQLLRLLNRLSLFL